MMLIRPVTRDDLDNLYEMASQAGIGVTTLPANRELLATRIENSELSFAGEVEPAQGSYMLALEDTLKKQIVGVSGIAARVGLNDVWYNYRVTKTVNASKKLGLHIQIPTLQLSNDMTNCTEICSLFLSKDYRNGFNGPLLSKSRFLFLADFPEFFSSKIFAEMRGYTDQQGNSPFWENLGRKFFGMEFKKADYLTGLGDKSFIAELMPKNPIFIPFFEQAAQDVIGKVHPQTKPALAMLEREGFNYNGMVDIFDAGPLVEAFTGNIRAIRESRTYHVSELQLASELEPDVGLTPCMVSSRSFAEFRVGLINAEQISQDTVILSREMQSQLAVKPGDEVRAVALSSDTSHPGPKDSWYSKEI